MTKSCDIILKNFRYLEISFIKILSKQFFLIHRTIFVLFIDILFVTIKELMETKKRLRKESSILYFFAMVKIS